jgi:hypothetical protein
LDLPQIDMNEQKGYVKKYMLRLLNMRSLFNRKLITFLFFVLISTAFWIVRSLGELYITEVMYPVHYINFPENKVLIGEVPQRLLLRVQARGFSIMKSKLNSNLLPLRFDVNSFSLKSMGTDTFFIPTESVKDLLSEELNQVKILDISPDTLFFRFTDNITRKVAIKPLINQHQQLYQKQFMQNGDIIVVPDSVSISGPGNLVYAMKSISTEVLDFNDLSDTVTTECMLNTAKLITYSVQKVKVTIPVDRFTEVEENLSIKPVNVPDGMEMIAIPGQVRITYRVCLSNYKKVISNPLLPKVDYLEILKSDVQRLRVFLSDTPRIVSNVRFSPQETEFLITRK